MSDPRLFEWLALRRVHEGGVAKSAGAYFDHGRPVPSHLTEVFDRLTWTELATVADGDPVWSLRRLSLTDTGQARYTALSQQRQRVALPAPPPEFGTPTNRPDHRPNGATLAAPSDRSKPGVPMGDHDRD